MTTSMHDFAATLAYPDLPKSLVQLLRRSFLDTIGVAAIGSTTALSHIARQGASALFGTGSAGSSRILFDGRAVSPAGAAMAGAFTIDSIDAHDGTSPNKGHAGSAVFPALLAVADALQAGGRPVSGRDFAAWLAIAYEVSYRAGRVQHATCADYHTSGAWTAVGIAATIARMLDCPPDTIRHAAGIGEYHGPRSQMMRCIDHPSMLRDGVGWGAPSGVTAAYLAQAGFTGAPALTCEGDAAAPHWDDIGDRWRTLEDTHYKLYPCCRWAHPSMEAAAALMTDHALDHRDVDGVEIRTFHNATRLAGHEPRTLDDLAYSIAFPVAAMIVRGRFGPDEVDPASYRDPDILRVSRMVQLIDDPEMNARSVGRRWAAVTLVLNDGRRLSSEPRMPRGDHDDPLTDDEIARKFHLLADDVLGKAVAAEVEALCRDFDQLSPDAFRRLVDVCLSAPARGAGEAPKLTLDARA